MSQRRRNNVRKRNVKRNVEQRVLQDMTIVKVAHNPRKQRSVICPEYKISTLHFTSDLLQSSSIGSTFWSKVYKANDLYDPDPALLSSGIAGFAELARYYYYHLVTKVRVSVTVSNLEGFSVKFFFGFFTEDPSTSLGSVQNIIDLAENPMCTPIAEISAKGGVDRKVLHLSCNLAEFTGDYSYYYGSGYFSTYYNASPATNIILCMCAYSNGIFTSAGFALSTSIHYTVKSFNRRPILDSGPITLAHNVDKVQSRILSLLQEDDPPMDEIKALTRQLEKLKGVSTPLSSVI